MSINGTAFCILPKGAARKGNAFGSHKYAGKSALRYELGICICTGHLVWIQGPYPAGKFNDIAIFNKALVNFLDPYERVEADGGQWLSWASKVCQVPREWANPPDSLAMQARVRSRHETFNGGLKNWGILSQVFHHDTILHGPVFRACAVFTQLMVENGEPLFAVV